MNDLIIQLVYLAAAVCFILSLKFLNKVKTSRTGVMIGVIGMLFAVIGTLVEPSIKYFIWIAVALVIGSLIGIPLSMVPLTAVPQRTALSHSFGAFAVTFVGIAEFYLDFKSITVFNTSVLCIEVLLGSLTLTASLMAAGKLQGLLPSSPITYKGQNAVNLTILSSAIILCVLLVISPAWFISTHFIFPIIIILALVFGVSLILPIGGADMPTVLSLLNSYAGLSASMMGFVLNNKLLIVAGALDGSSGLILSIIMCKAMNRSFINVLFGAFGTVQATKVNNEKPSCRNADPEEAAELMRTANTVMIVPGYGMAVAQAQHKVRELYDVLTKQGVDVKFAIHPVAGRMPGHMNVLLAEADIPYEKMLEMDAANDEFPQVDITLVIGANDVTNPAARHDKSSAIYGMPILDVDKSRMVMVIKRSMNTGFAGVENELYYMDKTYMLFGDAKSYTSELVKQLSSRN
jgi:NAD(P) transhydrogenase subunit beta